MPYIDGKSEFPLDEVPSEVTAAARDAARGEVVYLTEDGRRLAAIVPAEIAAEMESMSAEAFRELLEDFADAEALNKLPSAVSPPGTGARDSDARTPRTHRIAGDGVT